MSKLVGLLALLAALAAIPAANANGDHKAFVCHKGKTLTVDLHAVRAHLRHGDKPGACMVPPIHPADPPVTVETFSQVTRVLACASQPIFRQEDGSFGISADLDLEAFLSGAFTGATVTIARFYEGVGATCDLLGGKPSGETVEAYPVWVR